MTDVFQMLSDIGAVAKEHQELFAHRTRDREDLNVYRDRLSGVIYIDGFYAGDEVYEDGDYRKASLSRAGSRDYEIMCDVERRAAAYSAFVAGRSILEFGCGDGAFLQRVRGEATTCIGVELQRDYVSALNEDGIECCSSLDSLEGSKYDTVVSFHVLEHLPDPMSVLLELKRVLKPGGILVVEVPHARDLLISELKNKAFTEFTLWSQHLVLHTRESLRRLLTAAGFENIIVEGVQRYSLSNHLTWLSKGTPGGHKSALSAIDTPDLKKAYEAALNRIDATDTLVAIARAPAQ
ncbi:class I SAM-dependent methyltransferase [Roseibium sp.]|uniref:class I SAM-dependent methyltransferase n=1 Tax=Roseibium sp. TaxID=1936156 RepID=UPI003B50D8B9